VTRVQPSFPAALLAALAFHAAALGWVALRPPQGARPPPRRPPTQVKLATRPPPPPAPAAPLEPVKPAPAPARAPEPPRVAKATPPLAAAPPPATAPPAAAPPARRFAVSMSATSAGGGVAVPVTDGPTSARGTPGLPASVPAGNNAGPTRVAADATDVETIPVVLRQPSASELQSLYPVEARKARLEADVRVDLLVSETGAVTAARILEGAGEGFDEVALRAARLLAFRPAQRGGRPVAIHHPWTFKFRLDE